MIEQRVINNDTLVLVLAGGAGERLHPLTAHRSKPAVAFGGMYRIIDFTLSNCINSGLRRIFVLTQYKSRSLERHIQLGWDRIFSVELEEWIYAVPPQLLMGNRWYEGTADAVYQNLHLITMEHLARVLILSGDHVYKMNYLPMLQSHDERKALITVAAVEVPIAQASAFGVIQVDEQWRVVDFEEKPAHPKSIPGRPDWALINMGVYCFQTDTLIEALTADAAQETRHDFGHNILPQMVSTGRVFAHPFVDENRHEVSYWRDIGTLDAYYEASMDLIAIDPVFNLYDSKFPLRSMPRQLPPAKTVHMGDASAGGRVGEVLQSALCGGVIVSGGRVERSILSPEVRVNSYARVSDSVLLDRVHVGRRARIRRAIVDKGVKVPEGYVIGEDLEADRAKFTVSDNGIVVVGTDAVFS